MLPVIGLSFSNHVSCADPNALREVFKTFVDNGGKFFDTMHGNPASEQFHATIANELGVQNKLFWSTRGIAPGTGTPLPPGAATVNTAVDTWLPRIKAAKMDLFMVPVAGDPTWLAALLEEKKRGRVRYVGVQTIVVKSQAAQLESIMRNEPIDFIGVDYDLGNRVVEEKILPLAQERKIAVVAFFPFGNNFGASCASGSNLFGRVGTRALPEWAAEFDAKTWAHFFAKYVIGHPAITVARVGTTKAAHMLDNMGGGIGRLPSEATRKRMAEFIDAIPPVPMPQRGQAPPPMAPGIVLPAAVLDRYVGEYTSASGFVATFRREGSSLFVKPGSNSEVALLARTETRFQDPRGPYFEFQVDAQGKVTGAVLEQGAQRTALERK
jgi:aryl-alcohol dehydrogenase-like predicted oxidoreductase